MQSTLRCNRQGHNENSIVAICMESQCTETVYCCSKCITEHNHNTNQIMDLEDFKKKVAEVDNTYVKQLKSMQKTLLDCSFTMLKKIQELIETLDFGAGLSQNPTLAELEYSARVSRDTQLKQSYDHTLSLYNRKIIEISTIYDELFNSIKGLNEAEAYLQHHIHFESCELSLTNQLPCSKVVSSMDISNDNQYLAAALVSTTIKTEIKIWKLIPQIQQLESIYIDGTITDLKYSSSGCLLSIAYYQSFQDGRIQILDQSQNPYRVLACFTENDIINCVSFVTKTNGLISLTENRKLIVWQIGNQLPVFSIQFENGLNISSVSENQDFSGVCDCKGFAYLYEIRQLNLAQRVKWQAHLTSAYCFEFFSYDQIIMTSDEKEIRFWKLRELLDQTVQQFKIIRIDGNSPIKQIKAFPLSNPRVIISCNENIQLWNYGTKKLIQTLDTLQLIMNQFVIKKDSYQIFVADNKDSECIHILSLVKQLMD